MDGSAEGHRCERCGGRAAPAEDCPACGTQACAIGLRAVPGAGAAAGEAPPVPLVRQLKLPTLTEVNFDADQAAALPVTMHSVIDALEEGDFATADHLLDEALGRVLVGPGHVRRNPRNRLGVLALGVWCGVLTLVWLLAVWLGAGE